MTPARFPHSDTPGSTLGCQLPRAYRRLLRPSSALDAKASTMCPSQLVTHTTNPPHQKTDEPDMAVHTTHYKDARVHYPDLKQQPHTRATHPNRGEHSSQDQETAHTPHHQQLVTHELGAKGASGSDLSEPQQCAPTPTCPADQHTGRPDCHRRGTGNVDDSTSETPPRS